MSTTDRDTDEPRPETTANSAQQQFLDQLGGTKGMVYTAIPVATFVVVNAVANLGIAIAVALGVAALITVWRMVKGEPFTAAGGGLFGVAAASGVALWTGSAGGFFLIGIWASFAGAVLCLGSLLARRPLTGLLWNLFHGNKYAWRDDRPSRRAHDLATLTLTVLFGARFAVQQWLYESDATGWLATAKIAMGAPLLALALLVVVWAFRRASKRLVARPDSA